MEKTEQEAQDAQDQDPLEELTLESFMKKRSNYEIVDSIEIDDTPTVISDCLNLYCKDGSECKPASKLVLSYYWNRNNSKKKTFVCGTCFQEAVDYFKKLRLQDKDSSPLKLPKYNEVVCIDDDEDDENKGPTSASAQSSAPRSNAPLKLTQEQFVDSFCKEVSKVDGDAYNSKLISYTESLLLTSSAQIDENIQYINKDIAEINSLLDNYYVISKKISMLPESIIADDSESKLASYRPVPMLKGGEFVRTLPLPGHQVYVKKSNDVSANWVLGVVVSRFAKPHTVFPINYIPQFQVRFSHSPDSVIVTSAENMAYAECPDVRLRLGCRIIALFDNGEKVKKFFAGIVAEMPEVDNLNRYMVFFEDGYVRYVDYKDVRVICYSTTEVANYFVQSNSSMFISQYLKKYPERFMLTVKQFDLIQTEYKGEWFNARVINLDNSLVEMLFLKDKHTEWIYRGSARLLPVYRYYKNLERKFNDGSRPHKNNTKVVCYRYVKSSSVAGPSRYVAKKSTNRRGEDDDLSDGVNSDSSSRETDFEIIRREPKNSLAPKIYKHERCNEGCISWTQFTWEKCKGINPHSIPYRFGFRREINLASKDVTYQTPCGKLLKDYQEVFDFLIRTKSELTIDFFNFDSWVDPFKEIRVRKEEYVVAEDLANGKEQFPIACINSVDEKKTLPARMEYMTQRVGLRGDVTLNTDKEFLVGCDCTDGCQDRNKCSCIQLTLQGYAAITKNEKVDLVGVGYQNRRLHDYIPSGIYECNSMCKCSKSCLNRVVQHPMRVQLQLYKTIKKGWGIRCVNDIPAGTFVCVYVGEIISDDKANERGQRGGDEYFAELDFIEVVEGIKEGYESEVKNESADEDKSEGDPSEEPSSSSSTARKSLRSKSNLDSQKPRQTAVKSTNNAKLNRSQNLSVENYDENSNDGRVPSSLAPMNNEKDKEDEGSRSIRSFYFEENGTVNDGIYVMDAKKAGNIGRYLNHSCSPNLFVQNVFVDTHDLRFPWIAFFARQFISAGSELTWDYRYEVGSVVGKVLFCYCSTSECRGRLL